MKKMDQEKRAQPQQKVLDEIVRTYIAPTMKGLGFKKKGRKFHKEEPPYTKSLRVESSMNNTRDDVRFWVRYRVEGENKYYDGSFTIINQRGGTYEKTYNLTPTVDPDELGEEIQSDIKEQAVPFFDGGFLDKRPNYL